MSWDLFRAEVDCCGRTYDWLVEHPPIPYIAARFILDGEMEVQECVVCGRELEVPADSPHTRSHRTLRGDNTGCRCAL